MNTNPNRQPKSRRGRESPPRRASASVPNELIWALIGLLLTIFSTFVPVSLASWSAAGLSSQKLGITYQIGAVLLTGCLGGKNAGLLAQVAYIFLGLTFRTKFNGFYSDDIFEIEDKPIMSVYQNEQDEEYKSNYLVA